MHNLIQAKLKSNGLVFSLIPHNYVPLETTFLLINYLLSKILRLYIRLHVV